MEKICFQLISNSGGAKSSYIEAIQFAKQGDFEEALNKVEEAKEYFNQAHQVHSELIQKEAMGEGVEFSLLFMHAEDQMASTELAQLLSQELIALYQKLEK